MNLMRMNGRLAKPEDAQALSTLVNSAYRGESSKQGWTTEADLLGGQRTDPEIIGKMISTPGNVILVIERFGEMVGCVFLQKKGTCAYLGLLTVKPILQGSGLGKQLLTVAEDWVYREWQIRKIEMTVIHQRSELIAWYIRKGYQDTGRREPFPYNNPQFGVPKVSDLEFLVLEKELRQE